MSDPPIKGKISVEVGKKSVDKLVDAIIDVFSPGTEFLGAVGDAVRLGRVEMAVRITRRAGEIAKKNGLRLMVPPLKFLVPFYEKASFEQDDEPKLVEMWANLLASSSTGAVGNLPLYVNILSILTREHVELLEIMASKAKVNATSNIVQFGKLITRSDFSPIVASKKQTLFEVDRISRALRLRAIILHRFKRAGNHPLDVKFVILLNNGTNAPFSSPDDLSNICKGDPLAIRNSQQVLWEALVQYGIISSIAKPFNQDSNDSIFVDYYCYTSLGADFWSSCNEVNATT